MAFYSYPYVSTSGDRKITAQNEADRLNLVVGSGVVFDTPSSFSCSKSEQTMGIDVAVGAAIIGGRAVISDAEVTVTLATGHASYSRIDIVALESNTNTAVRGGRVVIVEGTPAAAPIEPEVAFGNGVFQIKLLAVTVPAGAGSLSNATLIDKRKAAAGKHAHTIADITDLVNQLAGKSPTVHTHTQSNITGLTTDLANISAAVNSKEPLLSADRKRKITISSSPPSGGSDGDIWLQYIP